MNSKVSFQIPSKGLFLPNHDIDDPLPYYYKPFTRFLYRYRIQLGLNLLPPTVFENVLDFGYGSGLLLPTLSKIAKNLYGLDLVSEPDIVQPVLDKLDIKAELVKGDITTVDYSKDFFDLIVCFSVFEHIENPEEILHKMYEILKPGGILLVGMPRVDKKMERLFDFIGYHNIDQHHVSQHKDFIKIAEKYLILTQRNRLFGFLPKNFGLYFNMLFEKN